MQVSYHIFSNTQLQRELDKARGKNKHNEEAKEIMRLKVLASHRLIQKLRERARLKSCREAEKPPNKATAVCVFVPGD